MAGSDRLNLIDDLAISQGQKYEITIVFAGLTEAGQPINLTEYTLQSQIRRSLEGPVLANFSFGKVIFEVSTGRNFIPMALDAATTAKLPRTRRWRFYSFDVKATKGDRVIKVLPPGSVRVKGEVTRA